MSNRLKRLTLLTTLLTIMFLMVSSFALAKPNKNIDVDARHEIELIVVSQEYQGTSSNQAKVEFNRDSDRFTVDEASSKSSISTKLSHTFVKETTTEFESLRSLGQNTTITIESSRNIIFSTSQSIENSDSKSKEKGSSSSHEYEAEIEHDFIIVSGKARFQRTNTDHESTTISNSSTKQSGNVRTEETTRVDASQQAQTYEISTGKRLAYTLTKTESFEKDLTINPSSAGTYIAKSVVRIFRGLKRQYLLKFNVNVKSEGRKLSTDEAMEYLILKDFNQRCFTLENDQIIAVSLSYVRHDAYDITAHVFKLNENEKEIPSLDIERETSIPFPVKKLEVFKCPLDTTITQQLATRLHKKLVIKSPIRNLFSRKFTKKLLGNHTQVKALQCQLTQDLAERFICANPQLSQMYDQLNTTLAHSLKLAPDHIDLLLKQSQKSWQKYWPRKCSRKDRQIKNFEFECVKQSLEDRLNILKRSKEYDAFLLFSIATYQSTWHEYAGGEIASRVIVYDQIHQKTPNIHSKFSQKAISRINYLLQPTQKNQQQLNNRESIYHAERRFVHNVSDLWGIQEKVIEWCVGCNGSESISNSYLWILRDHLNLLQISDIFYGNKWQSKLVEVVKKSLRSCLGRAPYMSEKEMKELIFNTSNWQIEPHGFSLEYHLAYYDSRRCLITWNELAANGISFRFTPQVF